MGIINDIFRRHAPEYLRRFGDSIPPVHKKVIAAIIGCRADGSGTVLYHCESCGKKHLVNRSCGNRHCPQCQHHKAMAWLDRQMQRMLPGHHFMATFTVPQEIRDFIRSHQRLCYAALFDASAEAIKTLCLDPRLIGGDIPGFFAVLHTWGQQLQYHPHIHFVIPGGAINTKEGRWKRSGERFFLPVEPLSIIFRAKFRDRVEQAGLLDRIPKEVWQKQKPWNVNIQAVGASEASIKYLAPYVFRVAISDSRIVNVEGDRVFFRHKHKKSNRLRTMDLDVIEFIRRFLQHVLPTGFMKVRHYGFLSHSCRLALEEVRAKIELAYGFEVTTPQVPAPRPKPKPTCPDCGNTLRYLFFIPARGLATQPSG